MSCEFGLRSWTDTVRSAARAAENRPVYSVQVGGRSRVNGKYESSRRRGFHRWRLVARGRSSCCLLPLQSPNIRRRGAPSYHRIWVFVAVVAMADSLTTEVVRVQHLL